MPLAIAVGRRITVLIFTLVLILGCFLCAVAKTYEWHLGARMVLGLSAGQSEALVPLITQVIDPQLSAFFEATLTLLKGDIFPPRKGKMPHGSTGHPGADDNGLGAFC